MRYLIAMLLLGACATTSRAQLGDIRLRPYTQLGGYPTVFSVQQGRILAPGLDVVADADDCVRGTIQGAPLQLCMKPGGAPLEEGAKVQRWTGPSGDFTVEVEEQGKRMRADGWIIAGAQGQNLPVHATVPFGNGPQWDELRKHPALLAIAATSAGVSGEPTGEYRAE